MDSLLAAAIHDVKNQLAALGTWLEVARREHPSAALDNARAVADQAGSALVALLAIHRDGEGGLRLAIDDRDLRDFCDDLFHDLHLPADTANDIERVDAAANALGTWAFDAYQVRLALLDALRNAARHARGKVGFSLARHADGICFEVRDDGPGYAPDVLAGDDGTMRDAGSGLGLRFARLIAQRHATPAGRHGRVELANDGGAVFRLILP